MIMLIDTCQEQMARQNNREYTLGSLQPRKSARVLRCDETLLHLLHLVKFYVLYTIKVLHMCIYIFTYLFMCLLFIDRILLPYFVWLCFSSWLSEVFFSSLKWILKRVMHFFPAEEVFISLVQILFCSFLHCRWV